MITLRQSDYSSGDAALTPRQPLKQLDRFLAALFGRDAAQTTLITPELSQSILSFKTTYFPSKNSYLLSTLSVPSSSSPPLPAFHPLRHCILICINPAPNKQDSLGAIAPPGLTLGPPHPSFLSLIWPQYKAVLVRPAPALRPDTLIKAGSPSLP